MPKKVKKDFDKEKMYSKIMPSFVTPPPQAAIREAEEPEPEPEGRHPRDEAAAAEQRYILRNFIEDIVMDKLARTIAMLRGCECERCKKDVMAMALNELSPAYLVLEAREMEEAVRALRQAWEVKVASALIKAVQTVKVHPNHEKDK